MILGVLGVFLGQNKFSRPNGQLSPIVIHILKGIVPAVNFSYQKTLYEHPTRRHIFANTFGTHM